MIIAIMVKSIMLTNVKKRLISSMLTVSALRFDGLGVGGTLQSIDNNLADVRVLVASSVKLNVR